MAIGHRRNSDEGAVRAVIDAITALLELKP